MKNIIKNFFKWIFHPLTRFWDDTYSILYVEDPIDKPKKKILYVIGATDELWQVELICPCGCNEKIVLPVNDSTSPRWGLKVANKSLPTLHPSVWRSKGCKSHFFLRNGKIIWC